jgi:dipeptidase E
MKLLLTSNGLSNDVIAQALEDLTGKPRAETKVAFVPTAALSPDQGKADAKDWFARDIHRISKYAGFLDVVSLADLDPAESLRRLGSADVLFFSGGNTFYLSYWMAKTGLFAVLPKLLSTRVYAGISAGSMVATPTLRTASQAVKNLDKFYDGDYDEVGPKGASSGEAAGLTDFVIRPHFGSHVFPQIKGDFLADIARDVKIPLYAIDDQSAVVVDGKRVDVVSEGTWRVYNKTISSADFVRRYERRGLTAETGLDQPHTRYEPHAHAKRYLGTVAGSLDIRLSGGEWQKLLPGQELVVGAGQLHEALAGPDGWEYVAAWDSGESDANDHLL